MESDSEKINKQKAEALQALINGPLSSSISKLSASTKAIPHNEDFHFFNNFEEFKKPVKDMSEKSKSMLIAIGDLNYPLDKPIPFPDGLDECNDWLTDVTDDIYERFDVSIDEFKSLRNKEEEMGRKIISSDDGFQLVCRRNKKGGGGGFIGNEEESSKNLSSPSLSVKVASKDKKTTGAKPKVPFHIPTVKRPQDEYNIIVNNINQPFEHVWLTRSEDGCTFIHPLENLSVLDFVDKNIGDTEPEKPLPLESTPFTLIEDVKQLKELSKKLRDVNEFAVDLEHNQYRSFQGMTCLIQISTRTEDFIVDTLKLRVHVGPYLREVFKDPSKKKVMHGADRDILWLQRDFGIYVCNLFDTGQASRVLELERNSLEFLLNHFCGVAANKEYQNAEWRLRPLPDEMVRYAREDTHYLLHIFDIMKGMLLSASTSSENGEDLLLEVYNRSCAICMQLYEKELLTDTSYLYIYGLQDADLNSQQLAIVAGLCEWRDAVARMEDESTGFILPNKALIEIARQKPDSASKLRRLVKSKHPYIEHNLGTVVAIIKNALQNAPAFEIAAEQLKERALTASKQHTEVVPDEFEASPTSEDRTEMMESPPAHPEMINTDVSNSVNSSVLRDKQVAAELSNGNNTLHGVSVEQSSCGIGDERKKENTGTGSCLFPTKAVPEVTVQVLKKPNRAFGALFGNSGSKRKLDPNSKDKAQMKVEQIKSSVTLPFHSFMGNDQSKPLVEVSTKSSDFSLPDEQIPLGNEVAKVDDIIPLESGQGINGDGAESESDKDEQPMSLSELSSNFKKCFQPKQELRRNKVEKSLESEEVSLNFEPFNYEAARKHLKFGKDQEEKQEAEEGDEQGPKSPKESKGRRKKPVFTRLPTEEEAKAFQQQARRRQAFPQSGNRSSTFRS
ncbi:protein RRP6-like 2 [Papaver somniferum]|uniref:protein RRP6-like 2 n=1 Tax=Papaver somniferum TaxID=3469 RepID=UPI000E6F6A32|nr:protein RRP6-like 2 [Papaver somniferum]